jgi:hypothetical protein
MFAYGFIFVARRRNSIPDAEDAKVTQKTQKRARELEKAVACINEKIHPCLWYFFASFA